MGKTKQLSGQTPKSHIQVSIPFTEGGHSHRCKYSAYASLHPLYSCTHSPPHPPPPRSMIGCYAQCRRLKKHSFIGHIALRTTPRESTSCCCLLDFSSWQHAPQTTPHTRPPPHPEIRPSVDQVFFRAGERASFLVLPSPAASPVQAYHQPTS